MHRATELQERVAIANLDRIRRTAEKVDLFGLLRKLKSLRQVP